MAAAEKNRKRRDREATMAANERKRQQKRAEIDARKREREQARIAREKEKERKAAERLKAQEEKIKKIKNQWINRLSLELEKRNIIAQNNLVLDLIEEANDSGLTATQAVSLLIKGNEAKLAIRAIVLIFENKLHSRHYDKKEIRQIAERLAKLDDMNSAKALADSKWKAFKEKCEKEDLEILELNNLYDRVAKLPSEKIVLPDDVPNLEALIGYAYKTTNEFENSDAGNNFINSGFKYKFTGQMEDQEKELAFLSGALLFAVFLILLILVTQFNAFSSPVIILSSVVLSLAGVFLGIVISRNDFVIIMTMVGIISLAGIVVNNAIVLVDYTNLIRRRKREGLNLDEATLVSDEDFKASVIEGGKTRLRPVLLTAITTILGLFPLASGLNINFFTLVSDWDPQIFFGGDNVIFFKPMSLAIIYGLTFATFLTLVVVPIMYYTIYRFKIWLFRKMDWSIKIEL